MPVLKTAATRGDGIAAVVDAALAHVAAAGRGRRLARRRAPRRAGKRRAAPAAVTDARRRPPPASCGSPPRDPFVRAAAASAASTPARPRDVALTVAAAHINFNGTCHGGVIFTLADTAFGLASNSHGMIAAGIDAHITYHVAAQPGDTLTATATEVSRTRKIAVYRIDVARGDGTLVAGFTGTVYVLARPTSPRRFEPDLLPRRAGRGTPSALAATRLSCRRRTRGPILRPR